MNKLKSYAASKRGRDTLLCFGIVIIAYIIVQAAIAGGGISSQIKGLLVPICAYVVMAISLNLTVGILGELSLGHAGFMSVGAFAGIVHHHLSGGCDSACTAASGCRHGRCRTVCGDLRVSSSACRYCASRATTSPS